MTSGERELRTLKALEEKVEEEQTEFLAGNKKNLYNSTTNNVSTSICNNNNNCNNNSNKGSSSNKNNVYMQLQAQHLMKLSNIQKNDYALKKSKPHSADDTITTTIREPLKVSSAYKLKFTKVLSLSAYSLRSRFVESGGNTRDDGKKTKKFSDRLSPSQGNVSPLYTPPPIRRCSTLHYMEPSRKIFKTLQQLEKQKPELNITRTLHRIPGTNKTYWKYGLSEKHQAKTQHTKQILIPPDNVKINALDLESYPSDELGFDETQDAGSVNNAPLALCQTVDDFKDTNNERTSCSVPLNNDSVEMMRLMLTAASTAITTNPLANSDVRAKADKAASSGEGSVVGYEEKRMFPKYLTLARYPFNTNSYIADSEERTVAYEAFHQSHHSKQTLSRRKSFSGERHNRPDANFSRDATLHVETRTERPIIYNSGWHTNRQQPQPQQSPNPSRILLKSSSADIPNYTDYNINMNVYSYENMSSVADDNLQSPTIITNPLVMGLKTVTTAKQPTLNPYPSNKSALIPTAVATAATIKTKLSSNSLPKTTNTAATTITASTLLMTRDIHHMCPVKNGKFNTTNCTNNDDLLQQQNIYEFPQSQHQVYGDVTFHSSIGSHSSSPAPLPRQQLLASAVVATHQLIDDELEQHIKHCSCSCNHMGYGNSMDYQTTGFGGLPDVTEHSNIRRTLSRQNSTSNSDSGGEIASIQQKSKVNFVDTKSSTSSVLGEAETQLDGNFEVKCKKPKTIHQNANSMPERNKTLGRGSFVVGLTLFAALCLLAVAAILLYQHFVMTPSRNSHAQRLSIVTRILRDVPLVDGHNNFAWNVRKYAHSSLELVHVSNDLNHKSMWIRPAWAQTDMERLKMGQVGVQVWSAFVPCEAQGLDAVQLALEQIDIIRRLADMYNQDTVLVTSSKDVQVAQRHGLLASLIGIEGGHAIGSSLGVLRSFYSLGARYLSLTHKCDLSWAGSSSSTLDAGLSPFGKAIVREMNRLGMMIDLSYSSDTTARDVLQATRAPVIFSHSGARQLCNSTRNIPDDILRLVAENGGLVMISFDSEDVACGRQARLRDVIDHIKYVRAIAGIQHIGLGAGYDSIEYPPMGLEDVSKYPDLLAALLEDVTWSEDDVAMLAGKNFLRIMKTVENVRDYWKRANIDPIEQTETQPKTQCTYMSS